MTLDRPADWPKDVTPPLYIDQAADVIEADRWARHLLRPLVYVRCQQCRTFVMQVDWPGAPDPDDPEGVVLCPLGPLVRGTVRSSSADVRLALARGTILYVGRICECWPAKCTNIIEHQASGNPPQKHPRIEMDDQWLALLDQIPDATVPAWCDTHGDLRVDVADLRRRAQKIMSRDLAPDRGAEAIPHKLRRTR